jgi:ubiquinone/menaquinone biosynthesis C-methylase UbiE
LDRSKRFEANYIKARTKENRVYTDEIVKRLPNIPKNHPLKKEWAARKASFKKLIKVLQTKSNTHIFELGCGNGWLSRNLANSINAEVCGMDVNEIELLQGARVFDGCQNLSFVYADIFTAHFDKQIFNTIIMAASIQYFSDISRLIKRLQELLSPDGEIYIIDTPFYSSLNDASLARQRTVDYFTKAGVVEMADQYHHHTLDALADFKPEILYNPTSPINKIRGKLPGIETPVFPIIRIKK